MDIGWMKLHRSILHWEWYDDIPTKVLFIHCILRANFEDAEWKGMQIKKGSFITSLKHLAQETGLSVQQVRTCIKKLEKTGELTCQPTNKYTCISLIKYGQYQHREVKSTSETTSKQQTNNNESTTDKNNNKKKKNNTYSDEFMELWKLKDVGGKADAYNAFNRRIKEGHKPEVMMKAWSNYLMDCHKRGQDKLKHLSTFLNKAGDIPRFTEWINDEVEVRTDNHALNNGSLFKLLPRMKQVSSNQTPTLITGNQARIVYTMLTRWNTPIDYISFKALETEALNNLTNRPETKWIVNSKYVGSLAKEEFSI